MDIFVQITLLLTFVILSAVFSGSETALFSLSRARLLSYKESSDPNHKAVYKLMSTYSYTLITLIFSNMVVNTAVALTSDSLFHKNLGLDPVSKQIITIAFAVVVLLLFGEVAPKTIALLYSNWIADNVARPVLVLRKILFPLIWVTEKFFAVILNWIGRRTPEALNSEEYSTYIEMSVAAGAFSESERELLESVFDLRQIIAEEVMAARVDLSPIRANTASGAIAERIKEKKQEFYPIINKDIDDSELLLSAKDFFLVPPDKRDEWQKYSTFPAVMIPANVGLTKVLKTLKKEEVPAALVVDEYGRSIGMISLRDVYTQLTGEVETIYDQAEYSLEQTSDNTWVIKGMIPLFELEEAFNIKVPEEYESNGLNGLFSEILGRLPLVGDHIKIADIKIAVQKLSLRRATEFKVEKITKPQQKEGENE